MIGSALSRLDTAEKLSIPQLQQAIKSGTIPAYMGVPLLEEKIAFEQRMRSAAAARMAQGQQPTIAEQVMDQAQMVDQGMVDQGGIDQIPIEAPEFAGGGIVAFEDGGQVQRFQNQGLVDEGFTPPQRGFLGTIFGPSAGMISREEIVRELTGPELQEFNRTGQLPARLRGKVGDMTIAAPSGARDEGIAAAAPVAPRVSAQPQEPRTDLRAPVKMVDGRPVPVGPQGEELGIAPDMDEEKPKVAAEPKPQDYMSRVDALFEKFYGGEGKEPTKPGDAKSYLQATETFFRDAGVNLNLAAQQAAEIAKEKESLSKDKSEAANFRLIEAGLAIMGGTSPNAFENIGKGASKAMQGYVDDIKGLKKTEKELNAAARQLAVTQNQMRMGVAQAGKADYERDLKKYEDAVQRNQDRMADLYKTILQDDRAREIVKAQTTNRAPTIGELVRADYLSDDPNRRQFAMQYLGQQRTGVLTPKLLEEQWNKMKVPQQLKYKEMGINTVEDYISYRMGGGGDAESQQKLDWNQIN